MRRTPNLSPPWRGIAHVQSRLILALPTSRNAPIAKRHGISEQTIYTWRKRFGGFQAHDVRRLKQLDAENARLKKLVAERDLEIEVMKEVAAKNW